MVSVHAKAIGAGVIVAEFKAKSIKIPSDIARITSHHGQLLQTRVKANASGRPGPNAPSGDYRRSINLRVIRRGPFVTAIVGTNKPQGRRLEYGFHGVDSLGRHFNQPPYPHFGPAMDATGPGWITDMEKEAWFDG